LLGPLFLEDMPALAATVRPLLQIRASTKTLEDAHWPDPSASSRELKAHTYHVSEPPAPLRAAIYGVVGPELPPMAKPGIGLARRASTRARRAEGDAQDAHALSQARSGLIVEPP
jgi:hypothetical protein